jgi:TolB-like protein
LLPLKNLSNDPNQEYFADGMTDELIAMLAKNSTLRVVSQTSAMQFKGVHRPVRDIARELGVDGIVEGSVDRTGSKLHMTVQLIHAPSDTSVWAESYDQDATDASSLPREVAQTIAKQLHSAVLQPPPLRPVSPEAHDAYLHGRYLWFLRRNAEAKPYFEKAVELQPDYALGWSGLAVYYGGGAVTGELDPEYSLAQTETAATKSVELDESLPEAHIALAGAFLINHWDWARTEQEIARAIALDPQFAEAYHLRAIVFAALNRHEEALEAQKKATALDPFSRPWALAHSWLLARKYDAAMQETLARQQAGGSPLNSYLQWMIANIYRRKGMEKEAGPYLEQQLLLVADKASAANIRRAFQQGGYKGLVGWQLSEANKKSLTHYVSPFYRATLTAQLGRREETLALLEEGYKQHSPPMLWVQNDPAFDFLHSDERYRSIIRGIGLPPAY